MQAIGKPISPKGMNVQSAAISDHVLITNKAHQIAGAYEALWSRFPEQMNNLAKLKSLS